MYKYKPSKAACQEYAQKMQEIERFCAENNIDASRSNDSYYFTIRGQKYRVSNHTIESSNSRAFDWKGDQVRDFYHNSGRDNDVIYIHAGKTRIIEIYENLKAGKQLDGRGNIKE
jgi:hypothetical protein